MAKKKTAAKHRAPCDAKTLNQLCELPRDNIDAGKWGWIIVDEDAVGIRQQRPGEESTQDITIPRTVFEKFARWYLTGSTNKP